MITTNPIENNPQSGQERFNFILSKLRGTIIDNNVAKACCPAHEDNSPSLTITLKDTGKINIKCFTGCDYTDILKRINLTPSFLYPLDQQKIKTALKAVSSKPRIVKIYQYQYANGHPAFETVRFEPKNFRARKNSQQWSLKDIKLVPYNLPKISRAIKKGGVIIFVEGEKDADNGNKIGLICTTVAGGCGKWREEYEEYFKDANIVFIPDRDKPGVKGVLRIAKKLKNIAKRIRILNLPVKHKGDLSDWIEEGGDKEQLWQLITFQSIFLDEALMINRLNKKHAVIMNQGKFAIINEKRDILTQRKVMSMSSKNHFRDRYENQTARITKFQKNKAAEKKGKIIYEEVPLIKDTGSLWIRSPMRRQYDGFCFKPGEDEEINSDYNLWKGFAVKPRDGNCSLYHQHIFEVVANGNEKIYKYILDWMADAVQNITKLPGVTIVLRGGSRIGKGAMVEIFGKLFGQHYLPISDAKHIVGHFNAHLEDCVLLFADEAFYAGDKQHESTLKTLITTDTRMVERKGYDAVKLPNYTRLIMASNKDWVAPLEMDDGRFFILDVSGIKRGDYEYFNALYHQMEKEGGSSALLYELIERDISNVNIKDYPATQAILDNKLESLDSIGQWLFYILSSGELEDIELSNNIFKLHELYKDFCGKQRPATLNAWSRTLRKFFPDLQKIRKTGENKRYYKFPTLETCRKNFEDRLHSKIEWDSYEYEISEF